MIDAFSAFSTKPHAMNLFYRVDGHPQKDGEKVLADVLFERLPAAVPSVFAKCGHN